jgi:hypothetical protein
MVRELISVQMRNKLHILTDFIFNAIRGIRIAIGSIACKTRGYRNPIYPVSLTT